jgi:hypothetical protein
MRYSILCKGLVLCSALLCFVSFQETIFAQPCPCDIYATGGTPCVAAFSTARALYESYNGPLYQVIRVSDQKTLNIYPLAAGGVANAAAQDSFLKNTTGNVTILYDQSGNNNNISRAPAGCTVNHPDSLAPASAAITLAAHKVYGLYMSSGDGYRNDSTKNMPTGIKPQGVYEVVAGNRYAGSGCCWDFGNAETNNCYGSTGIMACLYFGSMTYWGTGTGNGPWLMGDFEGGLFPGGTTDAKNYASNPSITFNYLTGMLKEQTSGSGPTYALRYGNAQSGSLATIYNGAAPSTWKLQGAIILGIGGDNSNGSGVGNFYEGALTNGYPPDSTEDSVQANIVGLYSGKVETIGQSANEDISASLFKARYNPSTSSAVISYTFQNAGRVSMNIVDIHGRHVAEIIDGIIPAGRHEAVWNARRAPAGVYLLKIAIEGNDKWTSKIVIGK